MSGERLVVELTFAASLPEDRQPGASGVCFVTPAKALKTHGVGWALDLQQAVFDWDPGCELIVDVSEAPGYGLKALQMGLRSLFCPSDHPAYEELRLYAASTGGAVRTQRPSIEEVWSPTVPQRRQKHRKPKRQTIGSESRNHGHNG